VRISGSRVAISVEVKGAGWNVRMRSYVICISYDILSRLSKRELRGTGCVENMCEFSNKNTNSEGELERRKNVS
jgi:hypothetical protein